MKRIITMLALALPLMGASCQDKLRANLVKTCDGLNVAYAHYDAVAATGAVSARNMERVTLARRQTDRVCASPGTATTVSVTAAAASAYLALSAAFKEGGVLADARMGYTKITDLKRIADEARKN